MKSRKWRFWAATVVVLSFGTAGWYFRRPPPYPNLMALRPSLQEAVAPMATNGSRQRWYGVEPKDHEYELVRMSFRNISFDKLRAIADRDFSQANGWHCIRVDTSSRRAPMALYSRVGSDSGHLKIEYAMLAGAENIDRLRIPVSALGPAPEAEWHVVRYRVRKTVGTMIRDFLGFKR